ncbi:TPA: helix-turn-helix domain-containing protein [Mannheimia haemolytica]|uniref:XRE family transcriptional regulator n=1 Tax=Mannheimia haemolytica TaxID=75985 RepID=UPI0025A1A973|nr:S24 family peptidase [Mannheimia haemolytica]HDL1190981.1 helix-turn-helix domain-containing protein [Mannheimia haemolytica]HDL1213834.1 helix-turn-helix domain-containing protein [Mannheimia haemolytica]
MDTLASRLKIVLDQKGLTQEKFAEQIGVSQPSVFKILNGQTRNPTRIYEIANVLDVDVNWLKTGKGEAPDFAKIGKNPTAYEEESSMLRLEVLDVYASAGNGSFVTGDLTAYTHAVEFENAYFAQVFQRANAKGLSIINVNGDSMEPTIGNGDLLFVDTTKSAYQGDGVYVFSYGENLYVKRLQFAGDELLVISDNPLYKEWRITSENEHKFQIHGKVEFMQGHIRRV